MNILMLGAPGSGKGSQAELIENDYGLLQISTGELLRKAVSEKSAEGIRADVYISKGELVPDELVLKLLTERLNDPDCNKGVILDGFPRNVFQAELLDGILEKYRKKIDIVFNIESPFEILKERLLARRMCAKCGKGYNMISNPPKSVYCECGGEIIRRSDDNEATIKNRLDVYLISTKPLINYYEKKEVLVNIDGNRKIPEIYQDVKVTIKKKGY
ncbi:MAG TPA: adenylate kinase [Clostridiales bacterium]|nr:adenylate kinase [Clostridiales bacterium]HQP70231.1 adenylate kinase [Clostridiales bacterium]